MAVDAWAAGRHFAKPAELIVCVPAKATPMAETAKAVEYCRNALGWTGYSLTGSTTAAVIGQYCRARGGFETAIGDAIDRDLPDPPVRRLMCNVLR